jgi:hypothetical protein
LNELSRDNDGVSLAPVLLALDSDSTGPADAPIETVLKRNFVLEGGTGDSRSKSDFGDENESEYLRVAVSAGHSLHIYPEGTVITYHAHIDMKTAQDTVVPWLASQTDVLAEDWVLVEETTNG